MLIRQAHAIAYEAVQVVRPDLALELEVDDNAGPFAPEKTVEPGLRPKGKFNSTFSSTKSLGSKRKPGKIIPKVSSI
jgi:hypothetical protein